MKHGSSNSVKPSSHPISVRLLVLLVALAGFAYLLYRLIQSWGQWPEDAWMSGLRIAELGFVGVFVLWALAYVLWPKFFATGTVKHDQGDVSEPGAAPDRSGR